MFKRFFRKKEVKSVEGTEPSILNSPTPATSVTFTPATPNMASAMLNTMYPAALPINSNTVSTISTVTIPASASQNYTVYGVGGSAFGFTPPTNIITFSKSGNQEIVRINPDGSVTWANGVDIDAAAESFAKSMTIGAEMSAGISKAVKLKMRDSVFEDLINIAKEKGSLTAEDLTYLLEASKIVEKLKGGR